MDASLSRSPSAGNPPLLRVRDLALFAALFVGVRAAYAAAGVRFDATTIPYFAQLLDPPLLRDRLLESLWFLHAQPPLFNLLTGLALKTGPDFAEILLRDVYVLAGFLSGTFLSAILVALGFGRALALGTALVFTSTPAFVLYENWYFYPHLEQLLILAAAFGFLRAGGRAGRALVLAFTAVASLALLRSLFAPLYVAIAVASVTALSSRGERRRAATTGVVALAVVLCWAAKNAALFGFFGTSSWGGNSLHRMMTESIPPERVEAMIADGHLHPLSRTWEFSPPQDYVRILGPAAGRDRGIPALDQLGKSETRENPVNYNHWSYPAASATYLRDAVILLRAEPGAYLGSLGWTARRFLDPVTDDAFLQRNRWPIRGLVRAAEAAETSPITRLLAFAALAGGAVALVRRGTPAGERVFAAFALGNLWVAIFGIGLEFGENNRFRYPVGGLVLALGALTVRDLTRAARQRWARVPLLGE